MKTFTALLVDDESHGLRTLAAKLEWSKLNIRVLGQVNSVDRAINVLQEQKVDFVFLDIRMPGKDGFAIFDAIDLSHTDVIFTTAHEQYALKAFKNKAAGYLLKPISQSDLNQLLQSLMAKRQAGSAHSRYAALKSGNDVIQVNLEEVSYLIAEGTKSKLYMTDGNYLDVSTHLKALESDFNYENGFYRIHHQSIINLKQIKKVSKGKYTSIEMVNGTHLDVSRSKKKAFFESYHMFLTNDG